MKCIKIFFCLLLSISMNSFAGEPVLKNFTSMETNHLQAVTPGLFNGCKSFTLRLSELKDNEYCFPLPKGKVISGYGSRRGHSGQDIKTKAKDTIRCVFDGVVRMAKRYGGYGNLIVVRHNNGLESAYSHNSKNFVKPGDFVKAGQAIALTGRTGRATTEHLHFEFRLNGHHFNPNLILDTKNHTIKKEDIECFKTGKVKIKK